MFSLLVSLLLLVSSVAVGLLLLLLLVLLVVCLVFRRRRRAKQPAVLFQTHSVRVGNYYDRDDEEVEGEEEEEEEDYVNVDLMDMQKNLKEEAGRAGEVESVDYEEPESDEDHDYEEACPGANFTTAKEFCFSVEENREEEEEEEEDYVNADQMDIQENLKEKAGRAGEVESVDYGEPESDEDHDYEEACHGANFTTAKDFCFSVEENREEEEEEEEEETSDDEADYENVTDCRH